MNTSKKLLSLVFCLAATAQFQIGQAQEKKEIKVSESSTAGTKPPLVYKAGDLTVALLGKTKIEGFYAKNAVLLNSAIPDSYHYIRHITDIALDLAWGEQKYGHKAVEWFMDIRQRNMWGDSGRYVATDPATVKIDQTVTSGHGHKIGKPLLWLRDMWLQVSLTAMMDIKANTEHYVKFGLFPFWLGRGIAFGPYYGLSKEFLGIYTYLNDQSAPGIQFHGDIVKDWLTYDLYYSRFEEKGASLGDTFNYIKDNQPNRRATNRPWRGTGKDNEMFAARLKWDALRRANTGNLNFEPYIFYNEASDQSVEAEADAKSKIGSVGLATEYAYKGLEVGGEVAFNFGEEILYLLDRNRVVSRANATTGVVTELFTHVSDVSGTEKAAEYTTANITAIKANTTAGNGVTFGSLKNAPNAINSQNRYRPEYRNSYNGWMAVIDLSYNISSIDLKPAASFGYASGDGNPHAVETDKRYKGFVGINENYAGTRVPSILMLDARKIKRPLFLNQNLPDPANDNSFTDLFFTGAGISWSPLNSDPKRLTVNPNVLFFWKDSTDAKVDFFTGVPIANTVASSFLGTELNLHAHYELLKDLSLSLNIAGFLPGQYYTDIRGTRLFDQPFQGPLFSPIQALDEEDESGLQTTSITGQPTTTSNIDMDDDSAFFFNMGLEYKF